MITLQTDDSNDLFIDNNGTLAVASGLAAVQNVCQNACLTLQGQIPLEVTYGVPYFDVVFGAHPNLELFRQYITQILEGVEHVNAVTDFTFDFTDGALKYTARIETDYGESLLNG